MPAVFLHALFTAAELPSSSTVPGGPLDAVYMLLLAALWFVTVALVWVVDRGLRP